MKKSTDIDRTALNNLEDKLGFKLEGERPVHFYFYFPEKHQAHKVGATLKNLMFNTEITYSKYSEEWLCLATKKINMAPDRLRDLRSWMDSLAQRNRGKYDGWETMIQLTDD